MVKPFLRWAGSKKRLIPELIKYWNNYDFSGYIEPFAGSAQLLFHINSRRSILNDINAELTNAYSQVKANPIQVFSRLDKLEISKEEYYRLRAQKPENLIALDRAARFIYLNRYCFNGLYRTNLNGDFNVPYGGYKTGNLPSKETLISISRVLENTKIVNKDFQEVVESEIQKKDFVYLDPPYAVTNVRIFKQYNPQTFGVNDLERLAELLNTINGYGNKFLVSYADCDEARQIFKDWNFETVTTQRFMKGFGKDRGLQKELLFFN